MDTVIVIGEAPPISGYAPYRKQSDVVRRLGPAGKGAHVRFDSFRQRLGRELAPARRCPQPVLAIKSTRRVARFGDTVRIGQEKVTRFYLRLFYLPFAIRQDP